VIRPSGSLAVASWSWDSLPVWTEVEASQDFERVTIRENERTIDATIQPANPEDITVNDVDWSLDHKYIVTKAAVSKGEFCTVDSLTYKIIQTDAWTDYGFTESIGELQNGRD
jgi:hypothetical protein